MLVPVAPSSASDNQKGHVLDPQSNMFVVRIKDSACGSFRGKSSDSGSASAAASSSSSGGGGDGGGKGSGLSSAEVAAHREIHMGVEARAYAMTSPTVAARRGLLAIVQGCMLANGNKILESRLFSLLEDALGPCESARGGRRGDDDGEDEYPDLGGSWKTVLADFVKSKYLERVGDDDVQHDGHGEGGAEGGAAAQGGTAFVYRPGPLLRSLTSSIATWEIMQQLREPTATVHPDARVEGEFVGPTVSVGGSNSAFAAGEPLCCCCPSPLALAPFVPPLSRLRIIHTVCSFPLVLQPSWEEISASLCSSSPRSAKATFPAKLTTKAALQVGLERWLVKVAAARARQRGKNSVGSSASMQHLSAESSYIQLVCVWGIVCCRF